MHVLIITHRFPRLYNTFIANEIAELQRVGVACEILSLWRVDEPWQNSATERIGKSVRITYLEDLVGAPSTNLLCDPKDGELMQPWLATIPGLDRRLAPLVQYVRERKFSVLHGAFGNAPATVAMCIAHCTGLPFTFETHAYDLFVDFPFSKEKVARAAFISTGSNYNQRYLTQHFALTTDRVKVIRISPDPEPIGALVGIEKDPWLCVTTSRLHEIKGLKYAVQAMPTLFETFPLLRYEIIGEGPEFENLSTLIRELNLSDRAILLGGRSSQFALTRLAQASILLHPSVVAANGDRDGTPTTIAEAMLLHTPIVATNVAGIPEMITDGESGYLVSEQSPEAIAEACQAILTNRHEALARSKKAAIQAQKLFSLEQNVASLIASWQKALQPKR